MKKIPITNRLRKTVAYAIVDNDDYDKLKRYRWIFGQEYAATYTKKGDSWKNGIICLYMHRVVNNCPSGLEVDHINHNKLDNRKNNLRNVTRSENHFNRKVQKTVNKD